MNVTIKKIMSTALAALVFSAGVMTFDAQPSYADDTQQYIKVGLKYASTAQDFYALSFSDSVMLGVVDADGFTMLETYQDVVDVTIEKTEDGILVWGTDALGEDFILNENYPEANCLMPASYEEDGTFSVNGTNYRGGVLFNDEQDTFNLINYVDIEKYLYGVINSELEQGHHLEALKAQTVAARSFTVCKLNTHKLYGFDLCAGTHCQVYKGYDGEYPRTTQAVDETKGETIKYNGKTVAAFYSKNSGGYTQASEEVWSAKEGYLRSKKDEYSPVYKWESTMTFSDIETKLYAAGYNIGALEKISIEKRYDSGAVAELVFTGTNGTATLKKEKVRTVLGGAYIKSTMFAFDGEVVYDDEQGNEEPEYKDEPEEIIGSGLYGLGNEQTKESTLGTSVWVVGADGELVKKNISSVYVTNGETVKKPVIQKITADTEARKEETSTATKNNGTTYHISGESVAYGPEVTFTGLGYGHGVGMAQDGVVEMAKKGFTYRDILKYYYTDIEI